MMPLDSKSLVSLDLEPHVSSAPISAVRCKCLCQPEPQQSSLKATDVGLSLVGLLGWFALPKCPLCLAAYVAIGSGLSISIGNSRILYLAMAVLAGGLFALGAVRVVSCATRKLIWWK